MRILKKTPLALIVLLVGLLPAASPALAETHPFQLSFGSFSNPNGIAVDEATGGVYVADLGTGTVSKFDSAGAPVESWGTKGVLDGSTTPAGSFAFPSSERDNPAGIAVDNSKNPSDPSAGDLYVLDAGHEAIDKFNANGEALAPITGPFAHPPLGVGVDANGNVHVDVRGTDEEHLAIEMFDDSGANGFVGLFGEGLNRTSGGTQEYGFASGGQPSDDFALLSCGCAAKLGPHGEQLGMVDDGSTAVAVAVDPATGHVYVDDQSMLSHSVSEWDTGEMNGPAQPAPNKAGATGTFVSSFGSLQLTGSAEHPEQGGIAVNGANGDVYVANPADGKVYVFGSTAPVVAAGAAGSVTQTSATLQGTVDPRGVPVQSCEFEYGTSPSNDLTVPVVLLGQSAECVGEHGESVVGATSPVVVHAVIGVGPGSPPLQPGSLYHFRLVVGNANGQSHSGGLLATASAGFGIKQFEVSFLNRDGTPDVQAGSHPFEMVTNIVFNTQVVPRRPGDPRYVSVPQDNAKDVSIHLPPGFYGDPNATSKKCTLQELTASGGLFDACPAESEVGHTNVEYKEEGSELGPGFTASRLLSIVPPPGVAFQMSAHILVPNAFINVGVPAGGDSGVTAVSEGIPVTVPVFKTTVTIFGIPPLGGLRPLLTLPTSCNGPLTSTISADSYQNAGHFVTARTVTPGMSDCAPLLFPPLIETVPDVSNASSSSGLNVHVHVSQKAALNPTGLAESTLRDTTVALPPGVAVNPSGADGLEGCSEELAGFTGFAEFNPSLEPGDRTATFTPELPEPLTPGVNFCSDGSKIATAELKTPLLEETLKGSVYLATPAPNGEGAMNPFSSLVAMYMIIEDPVSGTIVKIPFEVRLCEGAGQVINGIACQAVGQIVTTARNTPEVPFEDLQLHFFGGERAPLTMPAYCGSYTTQASFTPWDGNAPVDTTASFTIDHGPNGGPCPAGGLPFNPSLTAGATNIQAGAFSPFTMTMSRADGEQNLQAISLKLPAGLSGLLSGVKLCGETEANAGTCGPQSEIGETIVSVGVGSSPFAVQGGKVYITGPYKGAPFGLSIVNPADAGPFHLGKVIVRAKIEVDPTTAALTITSDNEGEFKIPQYLKGIPLQIKHVNVTITRPGFTFNPTNCDNMQIGGTLSSTEGAARAVAVPFQATNCASLAFAPKFTASTSAQTSRANGASLSVKLTYPAAPFGSQANIAKVKVELPKQLPSRLTTLQKACTAAQFKANPGGCPAASIVGHAKAITPLVPVPLEGPAYFVSNGGEAFPNLVVVLQGYGVTIDLVGDTFISKTGVTSSTFKTVPDAPVGSFELNLPEGKFSALAANGELCSQKLEIPTEFVAQNGATLNQSNRIEVDGCSDALRVLSKKLKGRGLALRVAVPAAGKLQAGGRGLSSESKSTSGRETVTIQLRIKRNGKKRFTSKVKLTFTPSSGKDRKKTSTTLAVRI